MPLLYGEGTRAFIRQQQEIIKETDDQSLFACGTSSRNHSPYMFDDGDIGIRATSPAAFAMSAEVPPFPSAPSRQPYTMTNKGLRVELRLLKRVEYIPHSLYLTVTMKMSFPV